MAVDRHGPWQPLSVGEVVQLFTDSSTRWWIGGGHALELQLLYKSRDIRPKSEFDASEAIPDLTSDQRDWIRALLPQDHPWQAFTTEESSRQRTSRVML
jgi:hypothetical protein